MVDHSHCDFWVLVGFFLYLIRIFCMAIVCLLPLTLSLYTSKQSLSLLYILPLHGGDCTLIPHPHPTFTFSPPAWAHRVLPAPSMLHPALTSWAALHQSILSSSMPLLYHKVKCSFMSTEQNSHHPWPAGCGLADTAQCIISSMQSSEATNKSSCSFLLLN